MRKELKPGDVVKAVVSADVRPEVGEVVCGGPGSALNREWELGKNLYLCEIEVVDDDWGVRGTTRGVLSENELIPGRFLDNFPIDLGVYGRKIGEGVRSLYVDGGLTGYGFALPSSVRKIWGVGFSLAGYDFPLPRGLREVGLDKDDSDFDLELGEYGHPLPEALRHVYGTLRLGGYRFPLPAGMVSVGDLDTGGYEIPLPPGIADFYETAWIIEHADDFIREVREDKDILDVDSAEKQRKILRIIAKRFKVRES